MADMQKLESSRRVVLKDNYVVFQNLVSSTGGDYAGEKKVITAKQNTSSPVVERSNAKGDLREVEGVLEASSLGSEAAEEFLAIINS